MRDNFFFFCYARGHWRLFSCTELFTLGLLTPGCILTFAMDRVDEVTGHQKKTSFWYFDFFVMCLLNKDKLCATYKEGYGNWDAVKALIDSSWQFKFDYFFKSKTQDELEKRCNTLLRFIEKVRVTC